MSTLGFTYYNEVTTTQEPTVVELLADLTGQQKVDILEGFTKKILPARLSDYIRLKYDRTFTPKKRIVYRLYQTIDEIEETSRKYMRGEIIVTPAEIDSETNEIITQAVYNTVPTTANQLLTAIQSLFSDVFSSGEITTILTKMVEYSKHDGTGNWAFYAEQVKL